MDNSTGATPWEGTQESSSAAGGAYPAAMILDQIGDAVIAIDHDERISYWGPGAEALYRVSAREALGRRLTELYQWRWESPDQERQAHASLERDGHWHGANVHVLGSGEERFVESKVRVLRDASPRSCE